MKKEKIVQIVKIILTAVVSILGTLCASSSSMFN